MPRATQDLHRLPDLAQAGVDLGLAAPCVLVGVHHAGDAQACCLALRQQFVAAVERIGQLGVVSATMRSSAASSWLTTKPPPTE
jgi:hypothetical protein